MDDIPGDLKRTVLYDLHRSLGAKMVPFAGYEMPVQYANGILAEHLHTRQAASLFDVSHMGQAILEGDAAAALETLVPADLAGLATGRMRYTQFTNENGGILDDLMVANMGAGLFIVVNASRKEADFAHIKEALAERIVMWTLEDRALVALQGPTAADALSALAPAAAEMKFMGFAEMEVGDVACYVSRSGYTGEDGYEISIPADSAVALVEKILALPGVVPGGLGARDTLRLEAGLCLYGSDIDEQTTPVEADLLWSIAKRRREEGGFPGAPIIQRQIADGPGRKRVGIRLDGRAPARAHAEIQNVHGSVVGEVTSGGFGPTIDGPIAMGYVESNCAQPGTEVNLVVRGKLLPGKIIEMPFVAHRYFKG